MQKVALELFVPQVLHYGLISIILPAYCIISFIYPFDFCFIINSFAAAAMISVIDSVIYSTIKK
jgi:hypothetical protein